jgi:serine-type D-Ala-D-Ala carboxypeptidase/endopeptidase (penicillin-binding protein 4)
MTGALPRRTVLGMMGTLPLAVLPNGPAGNGDSAGFAQRVQEIISGFAGSTWGMAFSEPDTGRTLYALSPDDLFVAGSAAKVFIGGTAFETLGPDYRFRTRVDATGPVVGGVLHGDLVLVAGGDLLLSGRIRPDGTLALPEPDQSYPSAPPLPGDPFAEIRRLTAQVRAAGVRRVEGRVVVDATLFREARESIGLSTELATVSPMMINDNMVHAIVTPAATPGAPAVVRSFPETRYVTFVGQVQTVAGTDGPLALGADVTNPDGTHTVTVTGEVPAGGSDQYVGYLVPSPTGFAAIVLTETLRDKGITVLNQACAGGSVRYPLAEWVSPPLA